jgi:hypothetical protein
MLGFPAANQNGERVVSQFQLWAYSELLDFRVMDDQNAQTLALGREPRIRDLRNYCETPDLAVYSARGGVTCSKWAL